MSASLITSFWYMPPHNPFLLSYRYAPGCSAIFLMIPRGLYSRNDNGTQSCYASNSKWKSAGSIVRKSPSNCRFEHWSRESCLDLNIKRCATTTRACKPLTFTWKEVTSCVSLSGTRHCRGCCIARCVPLASRSAIMRFLPSIASTCDACRASSATCTACWGILGGMILFSSSSAAFNSRALAWRHQESTRERTD
jgi:hypothetical protein